MFNDETHLNDADFGDYAGFSGAVFGHVVDFTGATFGSCAEFSDVAFGGYAVFSGVSFGYYAAFTGASFDHMANFENAIFHGKIFSWLDPCGLNDHSAARVSSAAVSSLEKRGSNHPIPNNVDANATHGFAEFIRGGLVKRLSKGETTASASAAAVDEGG